MGSDGLICLWRSCEHSALDAIDADMLRQPTQGKLVGVLSCDDSRLATMRLPPPEGFVLPPIPRLHEHKMVTISFPAEHSRTQASDRERPYSE
jgi:hypothetical protein